jgi:hypothetical protein
MAQVCTTPAPAMVVQQSTTPAPAMPVEKSEAPAAMVVQQNVAPAQAIVVQDSTITAPEHVPLHIDEPKAKAYLGTSSDDERIEGWYLDTGATNHMGTPLLKLTVQSLALSNSATARSWKSRAWAPSSLQAEMVNTRLSAASTTSHA